MAIPNTTFNHNFGQSTGSNGPNVIAVTLGAAEVLTLTNAGGRVIAVNADGAGAEVALPTASECTGQTRTVINTNGTNTLALKSGSTTIATVGTRKADRGDIAAATPNAITVYSTGSAWACIASGNGPADASA